jgi:hypothetical protein
MASAYWHISFPQIPERHPDPFHCDQMKKTTKPTAASNTLKTDAIIQEVQSSPNSFEAAFWRLLELTRSLEVENNKLKRTQKAKAARARQAKKEVIPTKKKAARPKMKMARRS